MKIDIIEKITPTVLLIYELILIWYLFGVFDVIDFLNQHGGDFKVLKIISAVAFPILPILLSFIIKFIKRSEAVIDETKK